jgi:hypothetical protein
VKDPKRDPKHLAWIRLQACCAADMGACRGKVEAHHLTGERAEWQRDRIAECLQRRAA